MRKRRPFRPSLADAALEDRVVLSQAAPTQLVSLSIGLGGGGSVLDQIRNQYIRQFKVGYNDLAQNLETAATAAIASGDTATLNTQVGLDLDALNSDLTAMLSLSPLAQNSLTPTVQQSIVGDGSASLKTQLGNLGATIGTGTSTQTIEGQAIAILNASLKQNAQRLVSFFSNDNPDRARIAGAHRGAPALSLIHSSYETQYKASFATFANGYTSAATTMLNVTDPTQIAANRPTFDAAVDQLVGVLNSTLSSMNSISPRSSLSLTPEIIQRLIGGDSTSLESQLRALATPTDTSGTSAQAFKTQSTALINQAMVDVLADLQAFSAH